MFKLLSGFYCLAWPNSLGFGNRSPRSVLELRIWNKDLSCCSFRAKSENDGPFLQVSCWSKFFCLICYYRNASWKHTDTPYCVSVGTVPPLHRKPCIPADSHSVRSHNCGVKSVRLGPNLRKHDMPIFMVQQGFFLFWSTLLWARWDGKTCNALWQWHQFLLLSFI